MIYYVIIKNRYKHGIMFMEMDVDNKDDAWEKFRNNTQKDDDEFAIFYKRRFDTDLNAFVTVPVFTKGDIKTLGPNNIAETHYLVEPKE